VTILDGKIVEKHDEGFRPDKKAGGTEKKFSKPHDVD
jgi:hypothetical protein